MCEECDDSYPIPPAPAFSDDIKASVAQGFREAIEYIKTYGWFQGDWFESSENVYSHEPTPEGCRVCAMGSWAVVNGNSLSAAFNNDRYDDMEKYATYRLQTLTGWPNNYVASWNDEPGRTVDEVLEFFGKMVTELEQ